MSIKTLTKQQIQEIDGICPALSKEIQNKRGDNNPIGLGTYLSEIIEKINNVGGGLVFFESDNTNVNISSPFPAEIFSVNKVIPVGNYVVFFAFILNAKTAADSMRLFIDNVEQVPVVIPGFTTGIVPFTVAIPFIGTGVSMNFKATWTTTDSVRNFRLRQIYCMQR